MSGPRSGTDPLVPANEAPQEWIAAVVSAFRLKAPRVLCLLAAESQALGGGLLLAAGARPLSSNPAEALSLVGASDTLVVGCGPFNEADDRLIAVVEGARAAGRPWVLDAAHADESPARLALARRLLALRPAVVRASRWEFLALAGRDDQEGFVSEHGTVMAVSDSYDLVTDGKRQLELPGRPQQAARAAGLGTGIAALVAAMTAVESDPFRAAAAGLAMIGVASERARTKAAGPGTFTPHFLDALAELEPWMVALEAGVT